MSGAGPPRVVLVSNRGPVTFAAKDGAPARGAGGLVTALGGAARDHDVVWVACAMGPGDARWAARVGPGAHPVDGIRLRLVVPDPAAYRGYYGVISNPLLWFVQHQLQDAPRFPRIDEATWRAWEDGYLAVNRQLAEAVADTLAGLDGPAVVLIQDYHLYLVPRYLRALAGERAALRCFCHIPWPGPDAWRVLPPAMRRPLLASLLQADRVGFQTERDVRRFLQTCVDRLPDVRVVQPWRRVAYAGRETAAAPAPISVDVADLARRAAGPEVEAYRAQVRAIRGDRRLLLRVDRVEPSKNILRGLLAYRNLLAAHPEYRGRVVLLALLIPSRTELVEYRDYLRDVMALVGELNATLGAGDWEPVRVLLGHNYPRALAALGEYDALLVNPLADGMNLVAKEGAVLNRRDGVLVLSEEAGAAEELGAHALLVSPYDIYGTREALHRALTMPAAERRARAAALARQVREHDIHRWFARQLAPD
ncbi:MAG TPA: trehalose-6-phosphate synthase [Thermomicrobiales bacterium]|nr:trehalose-6-phosphate synthase [Thermomicrobiales bacterium]